MKTRTLLSWGGAAALLLCLGGTALAQSPQDHPGIWLPFSASDYAEDIDFLYRVIFWVTTAMFVLTEGLLLTFCIIYRRRPGHRATYTHGNNAAEITWTIIPALMLLGLAIWQIPTWNAIKKDFPRDGEIDPRTGKPGKVLTLDVIGEQYKWNVRYPGTKAKYKADYEYTNLSNIHIPFGSAAVFNIRSKDVIHSVFIPHMRVKQDAVPGLRQKLWFRPNRFFLKALKDKDGAITPQRGAEQNGTYFVKDPDDWAEKPRMVQPMVFVYRDEDKSAPEKCLRLKDFESGGSLWDAKVAVHGHYELNGWYLVPVINGVAKKVQILQHGKVTDGAFSDCDYALGIFEMACAELCGMGHYTMRAFVYVEPPSSYEAWLASEMEDVSAPPPVWKFWRD